MLILTISLFIISCLVLLKAGSRAVKALSRIAFVLGLSEFTVAFVLMAIASSLPEFFVALTSALGGRVEMSFGNLLGSDIIDLTLALALPILASKQILTRKKSFQKNALITAIIVVLPIVLLLDGSLSRIDGLILLLSSLLFIGNVLKQKQGHKRAFKGVFNKIKNPFAVEGFIKEFFMFLLSAFLLLVSAEGLVYSSYQLAITASLPLLFIGAILVSLGTTLPELVFGLKASKTEHSQMTIGALMGAVVVHNSLIMGMMFLLQPLEIAFKIHYIFALLFCFLTALFFWIFVKTDRKISKKEAFALLLIYLLFAFSQLVAL